MPLKHDVIGQETQGPGGFSMALRSIKVMKEICQDMQTVCPRARLFNYTNPVNIVSQAVATNADVPIASFCEGPIIFPRHVALAAGLDPEQLDVTMVGVNHNCWSVHHEYGGRDFIEAVRETYDERVADAHLGRLDRRLLDLTVTMGSVPSEYFQYYYFRDQVLDELKAKPTTPPKTSSLWCPATGSTIANRRHQTNHNSTRLAPEAASTSWNWPSTPWTPFSTTEAKCFPLTCSIQAGPRLASTKKLLSSCLVV